MGSSIIKPGKVQRSKVSDKQFVFATEYCIDMNGKRAASVAGYKQPEVVAAQLLNGTKNPELAKLIGKMLKKKEDRAEVKADRLIREVDALALFDPLDLCDENGVIDVRDLRKIPARMRRAIAGFKVKQIRGDEGEIIGQEIEIKLASKISALELACKLRGLLKEKVEHEHTITKVDWKGMAQPMEKPNNIIDSTFVKQAALTVDEDKSQLDTADVPVADYREELTELGEAQDEESNS